MKTAIINALKLFEFTVKDLASVEENPQELKAKIYLTRGRGCIFLEGWETEVRRKKQKDGSLSFFRIDLPEPAYRAKFNANSWVRM